VWVQVGPEEIERNSKRESAAQAQQHVKQLIANSYLLDLLKIMSNLDNKAMDN
jgi:hypothetical protein